MKYIIKCCISTFFLFVLVSKVIAQDNKLKLYASLAFQGTDERIFGLNGMLTKEIMERNNKKVLPSLFFDVGLDYRLLSIGKFSMRTGIKYAYEWNNSFRNYNHCILQGDPCNFALLSVDGYGYHLLGTSFSIDYSFTIQNKYKLKVGATVAPMFRFLSYYDSAFKYYWKFEYFFSEILPNVSISRGKYEIGLYGRIWQHRKVDRLIYPRFSGSGHPTVDGDYMNINPWKIGLFIKYDFPF